MLLKSITQRTRKPKTRTRKPARASLFCSLLVLSVQGNLAVASEAQSKVGESLLFSQQAVSTEAATLQQEIAGLEAEARRLEALVAEAETPEQGLKRLEEAVSRLEADTLQQEIAGLEAEARRLQDGFGDSGPPKVPKVLRTCNANCNSDPQCLEACCSKLGSWSAPPCRNKICKKSCTTLECHNRCCTTSYGTGTRRINCYQKIRRAQCENLKMSYDYCDCYHDASPAAGFCKWYYDHYSKTNAMAKCYVACGDGKVGSACRNLGCCTNDSTGWSFEYTYFCGFQPSN